MRRLFPALFLLFAALALPSSASDATYTVSGVHVDASGYSSGAAQSIAFVQGRPKAFQILFRRLTRQQDWDKQPALDDVQLQRLIRNFQVSDERRSTTRYTAVISYNFNPAAVARVLRASNVAFTQSTARRILLVPMNPSYMRSSAWTNAFTAPRFADAVVPFSLPSGEASEAGTLAHLDFQSATWSDVASIALRVHATEAVFALIQFGNRAQRVVVTVKRVGIGETPMQSSANVPYLQTAASTMPAAADAAMSAIAELWKDKAAVDFSQRGTLTVDVKIGSLSQWAGIQNALGAVSNVTGSRVVAMDIGEARLQLAYLGTTDQLRDALAQAGLQLNQSALPGDADEWTLRAGSSSRVEQELRQ